MFKRVVHSAQSRSKGYDCLIPVSGGKDSTWQVIKCLEYGLNILAVTWKTPARTGIGARNLDNLINLGVDHIDYQISPKVEKKFLYKSFARYGTTGIPMHMAIFNIPLNIAVKFNIPLIVYGENSAFEYGSEKDGYDGFLLDSTWVKRFGVTHSTCAADWVSKGLTKKELTPYYGPTDKELKDKDSKAVFLGYYFKWDPRGSYDIAYKHGFRPRAEGAKTGYYNYADIDDDFISIHHYLKWYKFGFTRLFDNLSIEIRNGRIDREKAIEIVKERKEEIPLRDIDKFCKYLGISKKRFFGIIERFRNKKIWKKKSGIWKMEGFLIKDWEWK